MNTSIASGLKGLAASAFITANMRPGVAAAADMQEALLLVKSNLAGGSVNAAEMARQLALVKRDAIAISQNAPFAAEDVVRIENALIKAGLDLKDIAGPAGAAWAATALASLSGEAPAMVGDALANIGAQFSLKGGQYGELADWLVRVDGASATTVPALAQGLKMAGGMAAQLHVSAKDAITALGVLAPLGERAGSAMNNFFIGLVGAQASQRALMAQYNLKFFDKGTFVGLDKATAQIRKSFGGIKNDQERLIVLQGIFGEEGGRAAALFASSEKSYQALAESAGNAASIQQKMSIWSEGFNASLKKLAGTARSTFATLFDPLLPGLTRVSDALNDLLGRVGQFAEKNKSAMAALPYAGAALAAGAGGYGLYKLGTGAGAGMRVLKALGGVGGLLKSFGSEAAGIAKGKAVEAAAGVTPVYITNWPMGLMSQGGFSPWTPPAPTTAGGIAGGAGAAGGAAAGSAGLLPRGLALAAAHPVVTALLALAAGFAAWTAIVKNQVAAVEAEKEANRSATLAAVNARQGTNYGTAEEAYAQLHYKNRRKDAPAGELDTGPVNAISRETNPLQALPDVHNRITIAVHVDKEGKGRVITEGKNTTTRIHNPGSFD